MRVVPHLGREGQEKENSQEREERSCALVGKRGNERQAEEYTDVESPIHLGTDDCGPKWPGASDLIGMHFGDIEIAQNLVIPMWLRPGMQKNEMRCHGGRRAVEDVRRQKRISCDPGGVIAHASNCKQNDQNRGPKGWNPVGLIGQETQNKSRE